MSSRDRGVTFSRVEGWNFTQHVYEGKVLSLKIASKNNKD
jgi:hypothetical protein